MTITDPETWYYIFSITFRLFLPLIFSSIFFLSFLALPLKEIGPQILQLGLSLIIKAEVLNDYVEKIKKLNYSPTVAYIQFSCIIGLIIYLLVKRTFKAIYESEFEHVNRITNESDAEHFVKGKTNEVVDKTTKVLHDDLEDINDLISQQIIEIKHLKVLVSQEANSVMEEQIDNLVKVKVAELLKEFKDQMRHDAKVMVQELVKDLNDQNDQDDNLEDLLRVLIKELKELNDLKQSGSKTPSPIELNR